MREKILDLLSRKVLLKSRIKVSKAMLKDMNEETSIEREWHKDSHRLLDNEAVAQAVKSGALVKVVENENVLPILRFRNPDLHELYPPFLTPQAAELLYEVGARWKSRCEELGIDPGVRLALTSMCRSVEYQQKIIDSGKLAMTNSPHTNGEAFDLDGSGYYYGETPVNDRAGEKSTFKQAFSELDAAVESPEFRPDLYDPTVIRVLVEVLEAMQRAGQLHYLEEFPGTNNACYHVCRNPHYGAEQ